MSKIVVIEKIKNNTTIYQKRHIKYLSIKQRNHLGIFKNCYLNKNESMQFQKENHYSNIEK